MLFQNFLRNPNSMVGKQIIPFANRYPSECNSSQVFNFFRKNIFILDFSIDRFPFL